jgi:hypothetical protein
MFTGLAISSGSFMHKEKASPSSTHRCCALRHGFSQVFVFLQLIFVVEK